LPPPESARAQAILEAKDEYVVQLGVFSDPANVRKVQARVKAEGYNSFTEAIGGGKTRVRAGPFAGRDAAEKARDKLRRGGLDGMVAPKS
jgi:DedD protein